MGKNRVRGDMGSLAPKGIENRSMAEIELFRELGLLAGAKLAAKMFHRDSSQPSKVPSSNVPPQPDEDAK